MKDLQIFENNEFGKIRVVKREGEPWFVAKDVCDILEHSNSRKAVADLVDKDDVTFGYIGVITGKKKNGENATQNVKVTLINESGVYALIFGSRLEKAKKFKKWITSEVLPAIRKTGGYVNNDDLFINTYLPFADETTKMLFKQTLNVIREQNKRIQKMKPKAQYFDKLVDRKLNINFRDTAKELHIGQKKFINWLLKRNYIYRDRKGQLKPYQEHVNNGLFEIKEWVNDKIAGNQTLITPKGRETFKLLLEIDEGNLF